MARATVDCCYSVQKRNAPSSRGKAQRGLKCMLPSERSQSEKPASVTLWKRQKLRRRQKEQRRPGRRDGERDTPEGHAREGCARGARRSFRAAKMLCAMRAALPMAARYSRVRTHRAHDTTSERCAAAFGDHAASPRRFLHCEKCPSLGRSAHEREGQLGGETGCMGNLCTCPLDLAVTLKRL